MENVEEMVDETIENEAADNQTEENPSGETEGGEGEAAGEETSSEEVEEEVEEEMSIEVSLVEEVENLTDDLFQDEDLAYCEEAIKRESNIDSLETNKRRLRIMTSYEKAIKVWEECDTQILCTECAYKEDCSKSNIVLFDPRFTDLEEIEKDIKEEKWNVK